MASDRYVSMKQKACERVGIKCDVMPFDKNVTQEWLEEYILNVQDNYTSVMVQAPVYKHLDFDRLCSAISPEKDADGLNPINQGLLYDDERMGIRPNSRVVRGIHIKRTRQLHFSNGTSTCVQAFRL